MRNLPKIHPSFTITLKLISPPTTTLRPIESSESVCVISPLVINRVDNAKQWRGGWMLWRGEKKRFLSFSIYILLGGCYREGKCCTFRGPKVCERVPFHQWRRRSFISASLNRFHFSWPRRLCALFLSVDRKSREPLSILLPDHCVRGGRSLVQEGGGKCSPTRGKCKQNISLPHVAQSSRVFLSSLWVRFFVRRIRKRKKFSDIFNRCQSVDNNVIEFNRIFERKFVSDRVCLGCIVPSAPLHRYQCS